MYKADTFYLSIPDGTEECLINYSDRIIVNCSNNFSEYIRTRDRLRELVDYMTDRIEIKLNRC